MSWSERIVDDCGYELEQQAHMFEREADKMIAEIERLKDTIQGLEIQVADLQSRAAWAEERP